MNTNIWRDFQICISVPLIKFVGQKPATFFKKGLWNRCLRTPSLQKTSGWLLPCFLIQSVKMNPWIKFRISIFQKMKELKSLQSVLVQFKYIYSRVSNCLRLLFMVSSLPAPHPPTLLRSSHRRCPIKKCVLKNFAKFTGKHLCQSLLFNKVVGLRPATLLKKRLRHKCFPVNFAKFLSTRFYRICFFPSSCYLIWWISKTEEFGRII